MTITDVRSSVRASRKPVRAAQRGSIKESSFSKRLQQTVMHGVHHVDRLVPCMRTIEFMRAQSRNRSFPE